MQDMQTCHEAAHIQLGDERDKYRELKTFRLEVNNILSMYNIPQAEQLVMVKNWLGRKGLPFLETLMNEEKTTWGALKDLFENTVKQIQTTF